MTTTSSLSSYPVPAVAVESLPITGSQKVSSTTVLSDSSSSSTISGKASGSHHGKLVTEFAPTAIKALIEPTAGSEVISQRCKVVEIIQEAVLQSKVTALKVQGVLALSTSSKRGNKAMMEQQIVVKKAQFTEEQNRVWQYLATLLHDELSVAHAEMMPKIAPKEYNEALNVVSYFMTEESVRSVMEKTAKVSSQMLMELTKNPFTLAVSSAMHAHQK